MLTQEQKSTNSVEMFEATFDRGAPRTPDFDDAAALLATSEVMRLSYAGEEPCSGSHRR
jgi:hypothetical protein